MPPSGTPRCFFIRLREKGNGPLPIAGVTSGRGPSRMPQGGLGLGLVRRVPANGDRSAQPNNEADMRHRRSRPGHHPGGWNRSTAAGDTMPVRRGDPGNHRKHMRITLRHVFLSAQSIPHDSCHRQRWRVVWRGLTVVRPAPILPSSLSYHARLRCAAHTGFARSGGGRCGGGERGWGDRFGKDAA